MGKKTVIIGGVAGGASAAARLRRVDETAEIVMFERGEYISFANCGLPYYVGGEIGDRRSLLLQTPQTLKRRYNIDARVFHEAVAVDRANKRVRVKNLQDGSTYDEAYDKLVLGVGASPLVPPIPGIRSDRIFTVWNVPDVDRIKSHLAGLGATRGRRAIVVGAGFVGLEMVENLAALGMEVTLVEKMPRLFPLVDEEIGAMIHLALMRADTEIMTGTGVAAFDETDEGVAATLDTGERLTADVVIWCAGTVPNTDFLKESGIAMNERGFIAVNEFLATSDPHIYAGGDSVATIDRSLGIARPIPLAAPANKQARAIADNIVHGNVRRYPGSFGAFVLRVMGLTVAGVGAPTAALERQKRAYKSIVVHPANHATYYPGASPMTLKLLFDDRGAILGAQAAGAGSGADKAIDAISMAMQAGLTVRDLGDFDHVYAPPFSSAKSPVNVAGFVAENELAGVARFAPWSALEEFLGNHAFLLDVRTPGEFAGGHVTGAVNIPVDDLRARIAEVPKGRRIVLYCQSGLRNYVASRILAGNGHTDVVNLAGGFTLYAYLKAAYPERYRL